MWIAKGCEQAVGSVRSDLIALIRRIRAWIAGRIGNVESRQLPGITFVRCMVDLTQARDIMARGQGL